jgi:hypothetical protein
MLEVITVLVAASLECLINQVKGFVDGPVAISVELGKAYTSRAIDDCLNKILKDLFMDQPSLFPANIPDEEDLRKRFHRHSAHSEENLTLQAIEMKISQDNIDEVNR